MNVLGLGRQILSCTTDYVVRSGKRREGRGRERKRKDEGGGLRK